MVNTNNITFEEFYDEVLDCIDSWRWWWWDWEIKTHALHKLYSKLKDNPIINDYEKQLFIKD